ncbi:MAG: SidA/IucD/PvdA family monooxygenase [Pseudomonadota bacterium]
MSFEQKERYLDLIGIGFGPANIALAVALEERNSTISSVFLEKNHGPAWQDEMMIPGTDIQHNPLRDFATPRNPTSEFGYLSFLKEVGRLWEYLNLAAPYPPRSEYAEYVKWVADKVATNVKYNAEVCDIRFHQSESGESIKVVLADGETFVTNCLVVGCGRSLNIPDCFIPIMPDDRIAHTQMYKTSIGKWNSAGDIDTIAVIGASQSAAEVIVDLHSTGKVSSILSVVSGVGFKEKDLSPFTEQIYYPEYVDTFYKSNDRTKREMQAELWRSNYSAADQDIVSKINFLMYEQRYSRGPKIELAYNSVLVDALKNGDDTISLDVGSRIDGSVQRHTVDAVLLATGFRNLGGGRRQEAFPPIMESIADSLKRRADGSLFISRDYQVAFSDRAHGRPAIFLNGLCESTHGFGDAGSFSLLAIRADTIAESAEAVVEASNFENPVLIPLLDSRTNDHNAHEHV